MKEYLESKIMQGNIGSLSDYCTVKQQNSSIKQDQARSSNLIAKKSLKRHCFNKKKGDSSMRMQEL